MTAAADGRVGLVSGVDRCEAACATSLYASPEFGVIASKLSFLPGAPLMASRRIRFGYLRWFLRALLRDESRGFVC